MSAAYRRAGSDSCPVMNCCGWADRLMLRLTLTQEAPVESDHLEGLNSFVILLIPSTYTVIPRLTSDYANEFFG